MSHWSEIRRRARAWRAVLTLKTSGEISADAVLAAAEESTAYKRRGLAADHPLLAGAQAVLDVEARAIWYNADVSREEARVLQAHEYAHLRLHGGRSACRAADINAEAVEEPIPIGIGQVDGYGPGERCEREANVFAQEFLLPSDHLRRWFMDEGLRPEVIGARVGLPQGMVCHQLAYAVLVSDLLRTSEQLESPKEPTALVPDQSQIDAARAPGPTLIDAGPGTGKTRTLVERILWLLENGTPANAILALTFSNRAAEELRARIIRVAPEDATKIWMGTFHSFGLDLIRKYHERLGLPARPAVLAPVDGLMLLERNLVALHLDHYQNLYEPILYLREILGAISHAKDELVGPEGYMALADAMLAEATTPEGVEAAERAQEVARVYAYYEGLLRAQGALDFGDLITRPVALLQAHQDITDQLRAAYQHILVDEFQDVNHACGVLLHQIAGHGLWAVGDVRQSIYRWRGAAPRNVRDFTKTYPNAQVIPLRRNYRAQPRIINSYTAVAPQMRATQGQPFVPWEAHREDVDAEILMRVAEDSGAEGDGIAREINRLRAGPARIAYREQAVLCRSHTALARIAARIEHAGVPVLYLGDVFERPEAHDLLSLLSLACEGNGQALVRIARFPAYAIPLADVRTLLQLARERSVPFPGALELADDRADISPEGVTGIRRLQYDIQDLCYGSTPWGMLSRYLFEKSSYLEPFLRDSSLLAQQQRLVLFQFLQFAHEQCDSVQRARGTSNSEGVSVDAKRAFLRFVRRLALYGDDQQLRQVPEWAAELDAVRLLTIHGAKGLEFRAVYLPYLGIRHFPMPKRWYPCPPPKGLVPDSERDWHSEEEESLLTAHWSRLRRVLRKSRGSARERRRQVLHLVIIQGIGRVCFLGTQLV